MVRSIIREILSVSASKNCLRLPGNRTGDIPLKSWELELDSMLLLLLLWLLLVLVFLIADSAIAMTSDSGRGGVLMTPLIALLLSLLPS